MKIQAKLYTLTSPIAEPDFVELLRKVCLCHNATKVVL